MKVTEQKHFMKMKMMIAHFRTDTINNFGLKLPDKIKNAS